MVRPTGRPSCSAHWLRTVASCLCFSDWPVSSPPQKTLHSCRSLSFTMSESTLPPGPWFCLGALQWKDRSGPSMGNFTGQRAAPGSAPPPPRDPGALGLHGTCRKSKVTPQQTGSGFFLLPKQRSLSSTTHHLPLGCMPTNHACLRTKACTVCTPSPGPLPPPLASLRLFKEGRTRFLLLVLTPL